MRCERVHGCGYIKARKVLSDCPVPMDSTFGRHPKYRKARNMCRLFKMMQQRKVLREYLEHKGRPLPTPRYQFQQQV